MDLYTYTYNSIIWTMGIVVNWDRMKRLLICWQYHWQMDSFKAYLSRQDYSRGDTILSTHDSIDEIRQIDRFLAIFKENADINCKCC